MKKQLACFMVVVLSTLQVSQSLAQDSQIGDISPIEQASDAGSESTSAPLSPTEHDREIAAQALRVKELELQLEIQRQIAVNNQQMVIVQQSQQRPYWHRGRARKHFDLYRLSLDEQARYTFLENQRRGVFGPFMQTFTFLGGSIICAAFSGLNAGPAVYDEYGRVRGGEPGLAAALGMASAGFLAMSVWGAIRWAKRAKLKREHRALYRKGIVLTYD